MVQGGDFPSEVRTTAAAVYCFVQVVLLQEGLSTVFSRRQQHQGDIHTAALRTDRTGSM